MTSGEVDESAVPLRSEIAAFYAGFGQPELLRAALRAAVLYVPLADGDRIFTSERQGVHWLCGFTELGELARYWSHRSVVPGREYRYHTLLGGRLVEYAASRAEPTGIVVDAAGAAPMAFPPEIAVETTPVEV